MKKVIFVFSISLCFALAACKSGSNSTENSASSVSDASVTNTSATTAADEEPTAQESQLTESSEANNAQTLPINNPALPAANKQLEPSKPSKPAMSPEEAAKYKETINYLKEYGNEMVKCLEAKKAGKGIDESTKQRVSGLQNKLNELQKAGKMNKDHIELFKANNDMYNLLLKK